MCGADDDHSRISSRVLAAADLIARIDKHMIAFGEVECSCNRTTSASPTSTLCMGHPPLEITCCTPAFLRDNDDARDGVCMYVGQSQEVIFDGWNSRGVLIESRFVFDACFTRIAKTGPKNTALTA